MQQVVFVVEGSLAQAITGRRPTSIPAIISQAVSISAMESGPTTLTRITTTFMFVQCGLSTSETQCIKKGLCKRKGLFLWSISFKCKCVEKLLILRKIIFNLRRITC